jgi:peptidase E
MYYMNIVCIGGGDKNAAIDYSLDLSGMEHPQVLLIPTACSLQSSHDRKVGSLSKFFADKGLTTKILHEFGEKPGADRLAHSLGEASLIYTIGGNTPYMLNRMEASGIDTALREAVMGGKVHVGTSAGALLPFARIHSNPSNNPGNEDWNFAYYDGLGILSGVATAHANVHDKTPIGQRTDSRLENLIATFPLQMPYGVAIDNGISLVFGHEPAIIRADPQDTARAYLLNPHENGTIQKIELTDPGQLANL